MILKFSKARGKYFIEQMLLRLQMNGRNTFYDAHEYVKRQMGQIYICVCVLSILPPCMG